MNANVDVVTHKNYILFNCNLTLNIDKLHKGMTYLILVKLSLLVINNYQIYQINLFITAIYLGSYYLLTRTRRRILISLT